MIEVDMLAAIKHIQDLHSIVYGTCSAAKRARLSAWRLIRTLFMTLPFLLHCLHQMCHIHIVYNWSKGIKEVRSNSYKTDIIQN